MKVGGRRGRAGGRREKHLGGKENCPFLPEKQPRVKWKGQRRADWSLCGKKQWRWPLRFADFKNEGPYRSPFTTLLFIFLVFWVVLLHLHDCRVLPVFVNASAAPQEQLLSFPQWGIQKDPVALQPQPSVQPGPSAGPSQPKPSWLPLHPLTRRVNDKSWRFLLSHSCSSYIGQGSSLLLPTLHGLTDCFSESNQA